MHIVGIAGAGMSALARIMLAARRAGVAAARAGTRRPSRRCASWAPGSGSGTRSSTWTGADTVVHSTAINPAHLELVAARERGLRVLRRASALAAMITGSRSVAIAGTHGKTSTTSLLTVAAQAAGLDPSYAIGANLQASGSNGHAGSGPDFIVEADESDGSFLLLRPELALITNVEADHLENHGDLEGVFRAFEQFVDRIVPGGLLLGLRRRPGCPPDRRLRPGGRGPGAQLRRVGRRRRPGEPASSEHADAVGLTVHGLAERAGRRAGARRWSAGTWR